MYFFHLLLSTLLSLALAKGGPGPCSFHREGAIGMLCQCADNSCWMVNEQGDFGCNPTGNIKIECPFQSLVVPPLTPLSAKNPRTFKGMWWGQAS
ncbi:hypothetical protein K461DRAFT_276453 [Myriangium duriaei CBS 260.36]|uniref:Uncharacterized protein n=1 Tax=Myriangium duriaei CBS 260.36 TaxID=1168546 RepID=A0A9P4J5M9_9PEZI|nr:hypothetical protein K461DRAFT_276453 [Myriangium duriaei CBS 260.36]